MFIIMYQPFPIFHFIQPFRNSALGPAEPKTIYEEGDMGHKFVVPNPGKQSEETVDRLSTFFSN